MWWVPLVAAAASYVGSRQAEDRAREDAYNERVRQEKAAKKEAARQLLYAQQGIQWKVRDAQQAGISPLIALGASTHSASPIGIGSVHDESPQYKAQQGQDLSRAIMATMPQEDRDYQNAMMAENLKNARLKNELLASQLSMVNQPMNPPMPSTGGNVMPGQGNSPYLAPKAAEPVIGSRYNSAADPGAINSYGYMRTDSGGLAIIPSKDAKERTEDDFLQQLQWAVRNQVVPFNSGLKPPDPREYDPGKNREWRWFPQYQEFRSVRRGYGYQDEFYRIPNRFNR